MQLSFISAPVGPFTLSFFPQMVEVTVLRDFLPKCIASTNRNSLPWFFIIFYLYYYFALTCLWKRVKYKFLHSFHLHGLTQHCSPGGEVIIWLCSCFTDRCSCQMRKNPYGLSVKSCYCFNGNFSRCFSTQCRTVDMEKFILIDWVANFG